MENDSFEDNIKKLEESVKSLEEGDLPLKDTLEIFEKGINLSKECTNKLKCAQSKIEKLVEKEGKITSEPYENE